MFENPRRGRQARNFTTNVPKIVVLKWSSEQIFPRKLPLGAPEFVASPTQVIFAQILASKVMCDLNLIALISLNMPFA